MTIKEYIGTSKRASKKLRVLVIEMSPDLMAWLLPQCVMSMNFQDSEVTASAG